ncbi:phosphomevalonate kinase [Vagococcus intermedius]|uniref:phosphomevalonate kinase n=1 Tax=Vagococcus intermedius TaxID=2991418 RepID=A0AAF0CTN8_9ENTE|nr:phosphomevalonate kinase [Vagococcus intermedius]WEG72656.1 phosphomevalonate kinase [Vagococcus intermedius]WEG74741.1 phosphomevalonate kinase [Vagococcus intermedius]
MIEASAPGKLYIAGEYAVLEPGHPAILVALDQFITVKLKEAKNQGSICSSYSNGLTIPWTRKDGQFYIDERENPFTYVIQSVTTTESYLQELGKDLTFFDLEIESDLDNKDGRKYGLGSSGAVTVATIKALLTFHNVTFDAELVYKLAALTHLTIKSNGSFGDLAASSFGGWLAYSCFDREWVQKNRETHSLKALLEMTWPKLMIEPLTPPDNLNLLIGWTGSPASTTHLVDLLNEEISDIDHYYPIFLKNSFDCVSTIISAFKQHDFAAIQRGIRQNRTLLQHLGANSGVHIETATLFDLCEVAEDYHGAAKSSGAGGGDCGVVIIDKSIDTTPLIEEWKQADICQLDLTVHYEVLRNACLK